VERLGFHALELVCIKCSLLTILKLLYSVIVVIRGIARVFQRGVAGGVTQCQNEVSHQIFMSFLPPFVGCLLKTWVTKGGGGSRALQDPLAMPLVVVLVLLCRLLKSGYGSVKYATLPLSCTLAFTPLFLLGSFHTHFLLLCLTPPLWVTKWLVHVLTWLVFTYSLTSLCLPLTCFLLALLTSSRSV